MRLLGVILAGGKSSRFGSDKALAQVMGKPLMEHAVEALRAQSDALVIAGHSWPGIETITDRPKSGLGPLGGINAALVLATQKGFDAVLSLPVDTYPAPRGLAKRLLPAQPSYVQGSYTIGCWSIELAPMLGRHLAEGNRSVMSWIERCRAAAIDFDDDDSININTPADLLKANARN